MRRWEIWNEPNFVQFWRPQPDPVAYRQVYEALRATILRVDPTAEVAVGGLGGLTSTAPPGIPGLEFLHRLTRTRPPINAVAIHPYSSDDHPPWVHVPDENNFDDIQRVHDQLALDGYKASIWVTEWGWSSAAVGERRQALLRQQVADDAPTPLPVRPGGDLFPRPRPTAQVLPGAA